MRVTLSTIVAAALCAALVSGCDRPADKQATGTTTGKMGEAATGGTSGEKQQDPRTTPKEPKAPLQKPSGK